MEQRQQNHNNNQDNFNDIESHYEFLQAKIFFLSHGSRTIGASYEVLPYHMT